MPCLRRRYSHVLFVKPGSFGNSDLDSRFIRATKQSITQLTGWRLVKNLESAISNWNDSDHSRNDRWLKSYERHSLGNIFEAHVSSFLPTGTIACTPYVAN